MLYNTTIRVFTCYFVVFIFAVCFSFSLLFSLPLPLSLFIPFFYASAGFLNATFPVMIIPTITPNKPSALPKISITKIFTNKAGFCASLNAQLLPTVPTQIPHTRFANPTVIPDANIAYPENIDRSEYDPSGILGANSTFVCKMIATITP